jgi:hypothetical protein
MTRPRIVAGVLALALAGLAPAVRGQEEAFPRPTESDLAACAAYARDQLGGPAYVERAPVTPVPRRFSSVGPWTGPITFNPPPGPGPVPSPATTGPFGAGGESQEASGQAGRVDTRFQEAFDACMRARGF